MFFFSSVYSPVICSLFNVHMHMNDCFIAFFSLSRKLKKHTVYEQSFVHQYIVKTLCTFLGLAVIAKILILWIFMVRDDRKTWKKRQQQQHTTTRTRCSNINGSRCTSKKNTMHITAKKYPNLRHGFFFWLSISIFLSGIISVLCRLMLLHCGEMVLQLFRCVTKGHFD